MASRAGTRITPVSGRTLVLAMVLLGGPWPAYAQIILGEMPWEHRATLPLEPTVTLPAEIDVVAGDLLVAVRVPAKANARKFLVEAAYWDERSKNWVPAGPLGPEFPGGTTASTRVSADVRATLNSTATRWRVHVRVINPPGGWGAWREFTWTPAPPQKWPAPSVVMRKDAPAR